MTREEAIYLLRNTAWLAPSGTLEPVEEAVNMATEALKGKPRGKWIDYEVPLESGGAMPIQVCNLCSTFYPLAHTGGGHHFCPNCGADMRGGDDEESV